MPLKIYNSLTKQKEEFNPLKPGEVKMYVCGPTVYDEPHIGHLRSAYVFEVMRRYMERSGYKVIFTRNVTDVDDKIIDRARQEKGDDLNEKTRWVSEKYYQHYQDALEQLGVRSPDHEPRATAHIRQMIELINRLLAKDLAYESGGDVYFSVSRFPGYGKLSHQKMESMLEGVRIDPSEKKNEPLDFALWKKAKEGEPSWPSPWGEGRPGWHIECSAMSMNLLGETFDIHGGGLDLVFPHHENEIAQSEGATGKPFARYWIHHGLITINGHKMSKSLHNYVTLDNLPNKAGRDVEAVQELKFLFLGTHYTAPLDFSEERMKIARAVRERFFFFFEELKQLGDYTQADVNRNFKNAFREAMNDDFNTPKAIAVMHEMVDEAWKSRDGGFRLSVGRTLWGELGPVLGLFPKEELVFEPSERTIEIEADILSRDEARKRKDFKTADEIRNRLLKEGIALTDWPDRTTWRRT
jgi:cysteinyl-tRNA synthetase